MKIKSVLLLLPSSLCLMAVLLLSIFEHFSLLIEISCCSTLVAPSRSPHLNLLPLPRAPCSCR